MATIRFDLTETDKQTYGDLSYLTAVARGAICLTTAKGQECTLNEALDVFVSYDAEQRTGFEVEGVSLYLEADEGYARQLVPLSELPADYVLAILTWFKSAYASDFWDLDDLYAEQRALEPDTRADYYLQLAKEPV